MEHVYIEENGIPERYLKYALLPGERMEFEAHLVDCQECTDRVLLAEMFRVRNGNIRVSIPIPASLTPKEELPLRARVAAKLPWWGLLLIATLAALLLLLVPSLTFLWYARNLR